MLFVSAASILYAGCIQIEHSQGMGQPCRRCNVCSADIDDVDDDDVTLQQTIYGSGQLSCAMYHWFMFTVLT